MGFQDEKVRKHRPSLGNTHKLPLSMLIPAECASKPGSSWHTREGQTNGSLGPLPPEDPLRADALVPRGTAGP